MPIDFSKDFSATRLDFEVDFGERGGIHRFRFVSDLSRWIQEEKEFWQWLRTGISNEIIRRALGGGFEQFFQPFDGAEQRITWLNGQFANLKQQYDSGEQEKTEEAKRQRQEDAMQRYEQAVKDACDQIRSFLITGVVNQRTHLFRGVPEAIFVRRIAADDPATACFILAQFIQDDLGGDYSAFETKGRMLAVLFRKGWMPRKESDKLAYAGVTNTWKNELEQYKTDYNEQLATFESLRQDLKSSLASWETTTKDLQQKFIDQREANDLDLKNLKETYENFMQLYGPMTYWQRKRKEHDTAIKSWVRWCVYAALGGVGFLILAGNNLLPEVTSSNVIPWKNLGAFVMLATVVIWLMRFPFKMILSHFHLRADAKEREVMISTYMALLRGEDGHQGVSKDQLAMVLTPIFRPATSGIIKDDGGPTSLFDLVTRVK